MIDFNDKIYRGAYGRRSLLDCHIPDNAIAVVIFMHGYKGFKDWGCWNLMQQRFLQENFGFVKFNVSHNGGTVEQKIDFPDLDAFGKNTYSAELFDLNVIVSETHRLIHQELDLTIPIYLIGHSRGGGIAILHSASDVRIKKLVSLAGISDIASRFPVGEELDFWKEDGVRYVENQRTGQRMPHEYGMYEDFLANQTRLDIERAAQNLTIPFLQIHGDMDTAVSISEGQALAKWTNTDVKIIKGADHTFGAAQPWLLDTLPEDLERATDAMINFFKHGLVS